MTTIKIFRNQNRDIVRYEVSGHVDFDEHGRDILCAAVSVLSQTSILALEKVCRIKQSDLELCVDEQSGYLMASLSKKLQGEERKCANIVLESMVVGMEDLAKQYPKYIKITREEEDLC